ncbi:ECF transporter S component [Vagococcus sp.]|uniref:ECF transporter S component n=1 Tax=Vagococcus sp. TaxID=1933889 RepID=UPI002FCB6EBB
MTKNKKIVTNVLFIVMIPLIILLGIYLFNDRKYNIISILIAIIACIPGFYKYEKQDSNMLLIVIIAVLSAISIIGRVAFGLVPFFKPVSAVVILSGLYLGKEEGFLIGALSAIGSNIFFGQGPWTPFQMFTWGMIGFISGIPYISKKCRESKFALSLLGAFSGIIFTLIMDLWSTLNFQDVSLERYGVLLVKAIPVTLIYIVSNIIFLLLLKEPIGNMLERIDQKYGIKEMGE